MYLSIIIPAYNEEKRIKGTLESIAEYLRKIDKKVEVFVVDDGSRDNTAEICLSMTNQIPNLSVIKNTQNKGKGQSVKQGMRIATGEYRLFMDADNATPIDEIEKLLPYADEYPIVIGSRYLSESHIIVKQPWYRIVISRIGHFIIDLLLVRGIKDTQCGFKLFTKEAAEQIFPKQTIKRWGFDMEILAIAQKILKLKIKEVPVTWYNSSDSRFRPIRDAVRTLRELIKIKLNLISGKYS